MPDYDLSDLGTPAENYDLSDLGTLVESPKQEQVLPSRGQRAGDFIRQEGLPIALGALGALGGGMSPPGNIPGAIAGAAAGGMAGRAIQRAGEALLNPDIQVDPLEVSADVATSGVAQGAGELLGAGGSSLGRIVAPWMKKVGAQLLRVGPGIPEQAGRAVLSDPGILSRAKSVTEAGMEYGAATSGLKSGAEASRAAFGKSYLSPEKAADAFDDIAKALKAKTLDLQTALTLRQTTMKAISETPRKLSGLKRILADNIDALDDYLEPRIPGWAAVRRGYREAKIAEEFSSLLPLNKNLSPNVLRTLSALGAAGAGAAVGHPSALLAPVAISPLAAGLAIRGAAFGGTIAIPFAKLGTRAGTQSLADYYGRRPTTP